MRGTVPRRGGLGLKESIGGGFWFVVGCLRLQSVFFGSFRIAAWHGRGWLSQCCKVCGQYCRSDDGVTQLNDAGICTIFHDDHIIADSQDWQRQVGDCQQLVASGPIDISAPQVDEPCPSAFAAEDGSCKAAGFSGCHPEWLGLGCGFRGSRGFSIRGVDTGDWFERSSSVGM